MQALPIIALLTFMAGPARTAPPGADQRLRAECEALVQLALQKPAGWALPAPELPEAGLPRGARLVAFEPLFTPTSALLLHWSAIELQEPKFKEASRHLARGMIAAQERSGRIPARALYSHTIAPRDQPERWPDPRPTHAGLALLLTLLHEGHGEDEAIRRGAGRATQWLAKTQSANGAWIMGLSRPTAPASRESPPQGEPPEPVIRLDHPAYRNSTYALLYSSMVLKDPILERSAIGAGQHLLLLRIPERSKTAGGLWYGVYETDGIPTERILERPSKAVDVVACRHSIQTLLAIALMTDSPDLLDPLNLAAQRLAALRFDNNTWRRFHPTRREEIPPFDKTAPPETKIIFPTSRPTYDPVGGIEDFGLPVSLAAIARLNTAGREGLLTSLKPHGGMAHELARTLSGLADPFSLTLPATPESARRHLDDPEHWRILEGLPPDDIPTRNRRIHLLLLQARLQRIADSQ